jgi:hypothetical protein
VLVDERLLLQLLVLRRRERQRPRHPPPVHQRVLPHAIAAPAPTHTQTHPAASDTEQDSRMQDRTNTQELRCLRGGGEGGGAAEGEEGGGGGAVVVGCRGKRGIRHRHLSRRPLLARAGCLPGARTHGLELVALLTLTRCL